MNSAKSPMRDSETQLRSETQASEKRDTGEKPREAREERKAKRSKAIGEVNQTSNQQASWRKLKQTEVGSKVEAYLATVGVAVRTSESAMEQLPTPTRSVGDVSHRAEDPAD